MSLKLFEHQEQFVIDISSINHLNLRHRGKAKLRLTCDTKMIKNKKDMKNKQNSKNVEKKFGKQLCNIKKF